MNYVQIDGIAPHRPIYRGSYSIANHSIAPSMRRLLTMIEVCVRKVRVTSNRVDFSRLASSPLRFRFIQILTRHSIFIFFRKLFLRALHFRLFPATTKKNSTFLAFKNKHSWVVSRYSCGCGDWLTCTRAAYILTHIHSWIRIDCVNHSPLGVGHIHCVEWILSLNSKEMLMPISIFGSVNCVCDETIKW